MLNTYGKNDYVSSNCLCFPVQKRLCPNIIVFASIMSLLYLYYCKSSRFIIAFFLWTRPILAMIRNFEECVVWQICFQCTRLTFYEKFGWTVYRFCNAFDAWLCPSRVPFEFRCKSVISLASKWINLTISRVNAAQSTQGKVIPFPTPCLQGRVQHMRNFIFLWGCLSTPNVKLPKCQQESGSDLEWNLYQ